MTLDDIRIILSVVLLILIALLVGLVWGEYICKRDFYIDKTETIKKTMLISGPPKTETNVNDFYINEVEDAEIIHQSTRADIYRIHDNGVDCYIYLATQRDKTKIFCSSIK